MKASAFEQRHAIWLRLCVYTAAFSAYFFDRDDVVWWLIRDSSSRRTLEHDAFLIATLVIGTGAWLSTRAEAHAEDREAYFHKRGALLGDWLYAAGLSTLAPLWGCVVLVAGESLRILRLGLAERLAEPPAMEGEDRAWKVQRWGYALRRQATKWGVLVTMVVFTITLIDRVADYGMVASILVWAVLNWGSIFRRGA